MSDVPPDYPGLFFNWTVCNPKFAAYNGATVQGSIPLAGDSVLVGELAPGNEVFRLVDIALKASQVEATSQIVEREFGFFILRSRVSSEITVAREAILDYLGMSIHDRLKPRIESVQRINSVEPHQAQLLNKWRRGKPGGCRERPWASWSAPRPVTSPSAPTLPRRRR